MDIAYLKTVVEGALLAAGSPLSLNQLNALFPDEEKPGHGPLKEALAALDADLEDRAVELTEVGSGYRIQIRASLMPVISALWSEKPPRYSRALLETLAIIAYRQPITRGEIEQIRGVSLSANILRTLQEREWIKVLGHRDVPGRPELLGTTRNFLDYFNLKSLDQLPTLAEIKDIDNLEPELELIHPAAGQPAEAIQDEPSTDPEEKQSEAPQPSPLAEQPQGDDEKAHAEDAQRDRSA
ncbi:MAG: SMC-Scp complex subunit ScpB [Wenzhouxiangella sp.]|jgi:segregation and condensation protein B|nr:SMC-Scp complex subunit ScpB [Wenzhouxiangella sp.]